MVLTCPTSTFGSVVHLPKEVLGTKIAVRDPTTDKDQRVKRRKTTNIAK
jgi:hypothetical protein